MSSKMQPTSLEGLLVALQRKVSQLDRRLARFGGESTRGTTAERDAQFGAPSSIAEQVALANRQVTWFNTDLGWEESYYAPIGTAGLITTGLMSTFAAGWYPSGGAMPSADIRNWDASFSIPNAAMTLITSYTVGSGGHARAVGVTGGALVVTAAGRYKAQGSFVVGENGTGGRLSQITVNSATDSPPSYIAYGPFYQGQTLSYNPNATLEVETDLHVGDVVRLFGYQNSGGAMALARSLSDPLGLRDNGRIGNFFRMKCVGPPLAA